MARVEITEFRAQYAHFGFYRTSAGGDQDIFVRRKVGEPTDYMHLKSKRVQEQRARMATASRHYASLTPTQKARLRNQLRFVSRVGSGSVSEEVLLKGRQLFISEDIRELKTKGKLKTLPYELCIMLVDEALNPLEGELWLRYLEGEEWIDCEKKELVLGNWLFSQVPPRKEFYRVEGEATGYWDPELPEHQFMTESYLKTYHYHILSSGMRLVIAEPWTVFIEPPDFTRVILEKW